MTRRQLLANLDSRELTLWQKFLTVDGEHRKEQLDEARGRNALASWVGDA